METQVVDEAQARRGIAERGQAYISESTGFDCGDLFRDEEQVREYFTTDTIRAWLDGCPYTPQALAIMADAVIEHGWHMTKGVHVLTEDVWTPNDAGGEDRTGYAISVPSASWEVVLGANEGNTQSLLRALRNCRTPQECSAAVAAWRAK